MTQRIFDVENEKDMALLWDILQDHIIKLVKPYMNGYFYPKYVLAMTKDGEYELPIDINWHDKTEITRPIQEATEADKMKICCFWDYENDKRHYGVLTAIHGKFFELEGGPQYNHCRRLTKQEIEELC